ncbi:MAG: glutaredoxin [Candidatus Abyssobacteria bacterium SURF_17]|uniref:Glutaredoxin n=1 Tax=Candidatus Abyssobacteria bacterium SURF_17 TaxID=2093361 RepID=A0A419F999_9BACT|nr:MAG: glutaredoxin [Candidatus Abyssubacteria bacterium SURF_17]
MKLYHLWMCPYCHRVRKKLRQLGIKHERVWVGFHPDRWAEVEQLTGKAMVPVLVDGEKVINESAVICDYLEENYVSHRIT